MLTGTWLLTSNGKAACCVPSLFRSVITAYDGSACTQKQVCWHPSDVPYSHNVCRQCLIVPSVPSDKQCKMFHRETVARNLEIVLILFNKFVKHDLNERNLYHSFRCFCKKLVIDGQPSEIFQPRESPFHYPSFWQHMKLARALLWPDHNLQYPSEFLSNPICQVTSIASVCQDFHQTREFMGQVLYGLLRTLAVV